MLTFNFISQVTVISSNKIIKNMQAAGTAAKQINVIVCSHMCWQEVQLFGEEKVSCPWEGEKDSISTFQWHRIANIKDGAHDLLTKRITILRKYQGQKLSLKGIVHFLKLLTVLCIQRFQQSHTHSKCNICSYKYQQSTSSTSSLPTQYIPERVFFRSPCLQRLMSVREDPQDGFFHVGFQQELG